MFLDPPMPPTTAREALHALLGDRHGDHSVAGHEPVNLGVAVLCSCGQRLWIDDDAARDAGLDLPKVKFALRHAPRKPLTLLRP
jgi:hypothetical protein